MLDTQGRRRPGALCIVPFVLMSTDSDRVYVVALTMLSRRELSERQVRERLARREFPPDHIDAAIARLKAERALDDGRVAQAMARLEVVTRRHGKLRAQRQIEHLGIKPDIARAAIDEVLGSVDQDALLASALGRRLRGDRPIADEAEFRRLYRFLIGQGFDSDRILRLLRARRDSHRDR
jgi:regulatory protein